MEKTKKSDFQSLADKRSKEAEVLYSAEEYDGAYYLAGYAVECAIKACIIKRLNLSDEWPERKFSEDCYKHDLAVLLRVAELDHKLKLNVMVDANWLLVKDWTEQSRYQLGRSQQVVRAFLDAINHQTDGVLQWIKGLW